MKKRRKASEIRSAKSMKHEGPGDSPNLNGFRILTRNMEVADRKFRFSSIGSRPLSSEFGVGVSNGRTDLCSDRLVLQYRITMIMFRLSANGVNTITCSGLS